MFGERLSEPTAERLRNATRGVALAALAIVVLQYVLTPARMAGDFGRTFDPSLESLLLHSSAGTANIARVVGLALVAVSLDRANRMNTLIGSAGAALAVASFALTGHTTIHPLWWLLRPALLVHLAVAAWWFGALWPLRAIAAEEPLERTAAVVARFSALAVRLVPLILVFGLVLAAVLLGALGELFTAYGAMVIGKLAGFAALLWLAAQNRRRFGPRMSAGDRAAVPLFRRTVAIEWVLIAVIIAGTGVMTELTAPENLHAAFGEDHHAGGNSKSDGAEE